VRVYIRGRLSREDISEADLAAVLEARPNLVFEGAYRSPEDLGAIYGQVHFSWSMDYTDAGSNSDWLLPNRLYEGGFFGTVALARAGTATGRLVTERGLGMTFDEPVAETVAAFLDSLTPDAYAALRQRIVDAPRDLFVDEADTRAFLDRLGCGADRTTPSPAIVERHA
jgi:succinoglycan biosynthesis protein ExoL